MSGLRPAAEDDIFVGREAELSQLRAGLARALKRHGALFLLKGEPGIGKSRLAEQAAAEARERGCSTFWGYCSQAEGAPPHWPWLQVLRAILEELGPEAFASDAASGLAQIMHVVPELRSNFPSAAAAADDDASRFRSYDAVVQLLLHASRRKPILVVFEDLHWADAPSLILLQQLAGSLGHSRLLVIGTYRDLELVESHPLRAGLADFVRSGDSSDIAIEGLADTEAASLLRTLTAFEPATELVERLQQQTAGNPFFLKEIARTFRDETSQRAEPTAPVPEGVAAVLRRRIQGLSEGCRDMLAFAAVVGQEFDVELITAASALPRAALLDLCDEAIDAGVLVPRDRGYSFAHGLFRDTVYRGITTARRAELHTRVGRALEEHARGGHVRPAQLAHHFVHAASIDESLRQKALDHSTQAGEQASTGLAYEEAVRHFESALGFAELVEPARQAELWLSLGRARYLAGDPGGALQAAQEASRIGEELADGDLQTRAALVVRGVGGPGLTPVVLSLCEAALRQPGADTSLRVQLLSQVSVTLMQVPDPAAAARSEEYSQEAVRLARDAIDPDVVFAAIHARQMARTGPDGVDERLTLADRALALARETGRLAFADWGHGWRAEALVQLGRIDEAELEVAQQSRAAEILREPLARWRALIAQSRIALIRGHFDRSRTLSQETRLIGTRGEHPIVEFYYFGHALFLATLTGAAAPDLASIEPFIRKYPEMGPPFMAQRVLEMASAGRLTEARTALRGLAASSPQNVRPLMAWLVAMATVANAAAAVGETEVAARTYDALLPYAAYNVVTGAGLAAVQGSVARYLGVLATTLGRLEDAARHYEAAIAFEKNMGAPPFVACSQVFYAEMLVRRGGEGDVRRARRLAEDALAITQELGMQPWSARARAVLRSAEERGDAGHGLSKREVEVALLVSEGLSNKAIAGRLHVSERTAESHVKNICDKLGFNSRSQVAAWVAAGNFRTKTQ